MSVAIQLLGLPGTGKTYSLRNLNPETTYYINCDKKSLPFRGWKKKYNDDAKNYTKTSDPILIQKIIAGISQARKDVKVVIVDTVNSIMSDKEMNERKKKGFDKWMDYAGDIYDLYSLANSENLRDDLVVVFVGHVEAYTDNFETRWRLKTGGTKLTKLNVESKLSYTFYSHAENTGEKVNYYFTTQTDGFNTARSPEGLFEYKIPNDLEPMIQEIIKFENGE
jgi:hypothetical protein